MSGYDLINVCCIEPHEVIHGVNISDAIDSLGAFVVGFSAGMRNEYIFVGKYGIFFVILSSRRDPVFESIKVLTRLKKVPKYLTLVDAPTYPELLQPTSNLHTYR